MGRNLGLDPDSDPYSDVDLTLTSMLMHNDINGDWNRRRLARKTIAISRKWDGNETGRKGAVHDGDREER